RQGAERAARYRRQRPAAGRRRRARSHPAAAALILANDPRSAGILVAVEVDVRRKLAAEMAWIRRLAFALVKDPAAADDVAGDAWRDAGGPTPDDGPNRQRLRQIVVNLVRMRWRGAKRRDRHETAAGRDGSHVPSPDELVERVEAQRIVSGEVL